MTTLSVNINKIALIRNSRGGNLPDVLKAALDCERFGAQGITVHPRPDQRHIRFTDAYDLKANISTELNIEGNPVDAFSSLVLDVKPAQVTLVPDAPNALTSSAGWDTIKNKEFLKKVVAEFKAAGIRVSIFADPDVEMIYHASDTGADRVELYTEAYARDYYLNPEKAVESYFNAAVAAKKSGLGLNAGHDLNLDNLAYFAQNIPDLLEVSIGHALISDALYLGLENAIQMYLRCLKPKH